MASRVKKIEEWLRDDERTPPPSGNPALSGDNGQEPNALDDCIILPSGPLGIYESAQRVFRILAKSGKMFLRGGRVFELVRAKNGLLRLEIISENAFRSQIERYGKVFAWRSGAHDECLLKAGARCSLDTATVWLASSAKDLLPEIAAVHSCPIITLSANEIKVLGNGYHKECGGRFVSSEAIPEKFELRAAVCSILEVVSEFDFLTPFDKSRAIAAILTPALKFGGLLDTHIPLFVLEADDSQAGKGFFLEVVQNFYGEIPSLVTQRQGGVGGFDESLSQALLNGRPFVQLDNVRGHIGSPFLEALLTCPLNATLPARVPYRGEVQVQPDRFLFQLTSNGFEGTRDLANRSCIIRIRKRRDFTFQRYPEGTLLNHVHHNLGRYLGCIHSVLAKWVSSGKPSTNDIRGEGRFRLWAQVMDWIIQELFDLPSPLDGHEQAQERVSNPALHWLRQLCLTAQEDARLDEALTASDIVEISNSHSLDIPGLGDDAPDSKALLRIGCIMGKLFRQSNDISLEGFQLQRTDSTYYYEAQRKEIHGKKYTITLATNSDQQRPTT